MEFAAAAAVVAALGRALSCHDPGAAGACYAEDALYREVGTGLAVQGRAAITAVTRDVLAAFPDATFGLGRVVPGQDTLTVEWWAEGTHLGPFRHIPPTGDRFRLQAASVLRFSGSQIAEETVYLNAAALLRQAADRHADQVAVVDDYFRALQRGDPEAAAACFAPAGSREVVGGRCARGRGAIARQWRAVMAALPGFRLEPDRPEGRGGQLAVRYRLHGGPAAGTAALSVLTLRGSAIAQETVYANGVTD